MLASSIKRLVLFECVGTADWLAARMVCAVGGGRTKGD
jgi:hypothetical protein